MYEICRTIICLKIYAQYRTRFNTNSYKAPEKGFHKYTLYKMGSKAQWLKSHYKLKSMSVDGWNIIDLCRSPQRSPPMKGWTFQSHENQVSLKITQSLAGTTLEMMGNTWHNSKGLKYAQELSKIISQERETFLLWENSSESGFLTPPLQHPTTQNNNLQKLWWWINM